MAQDAESTSEGFLDSVLEKNRHKQARSGDRRWPAPAAPADSDETGETGEEDQAAEAYLPTVVGQRIRAALRGGQGRFGLLVATMVGLTSLPTFVVMRTGLDDLGPTFREPAGVLLTEPAAPAPVRVRAHGQGPLTLRVEPARITPARPHQTAVLSHQGVRVPERTIPAKAPAVRPVAAKPPKPAVRPVVVQVQPEQPFVRPVVLQPVVDLSDALTPAVVALASVKLAPIGRPIVRRPALRSSRPARVVVERVAVTRPTRPTATRPIVSRPTRPTAVRPALAVRPPFPVDHGLSVMIDRRVVFPAP
ncbi:hypothetical protein AB0M47_10335 [Hamadaea sp. NPDC051192]|uniref:hypothetical protein n=1 Tax=Hamadaea sp. NPDC051192 TaxID=3154940 RepID=UPI0034428F58